MTFANNGRMKPSNDPHWEAGSRILRALKVPPAAWGELRQALHQHLTLDQCERIATICEEKRAWVRG